MGSLVTISEKQTHLLNRNRRPSRVVQRWTPMNYLPGYGEEITRVHLNGRLVSCHI